MNTTKKISPDQLEALHAFIKKHYVEYYDLQNELADHLANAIEERWAATPGLSFDDALQQEFKKFGVFGFMQIVEDRQIILGKKYNRILWGYFRQFLRLPRIVLSLLLVVIVYKLISYNILIYSVLIVLLLVCSGYKFIAQNNAYRKKVKQTGKRWLFEDIIMKCGCFSTMPFIGWQFIPLEVTENPIGLGLISVFLVAFALYFYVVLYIIPSKAGEHLLKAYPEYKYVN